VILVQDADYFHRLRVFTSENNSIPNYTISDSKEKEKKNGHWIVKSQIEKTS